VRIPRLGFHAMAGVGQPTTALVSNKFGDIARPSISYSRFICTASSIRLGKRTIGRCLVSATVAEIKPIYCTSIKQQERSYFRHLKKLMSQIKERSHHCSARLHTTSTRCQNQSTPDIAVCRIAKLIFIYIPTMNVSVFYTFYIHFTNVETNITSPLPTITPM